MLSHEQLKAVRKIQIRTRHLVSDLFAGQYHSAFKGQGMEFAEVRAYLPGDDVRTIDWNVTARTGTAHVKRFTEERELTVMLLVDASASTHFGSVARFKQELAAEVGALFAFSAITNNDKVGLIIFSDEIELALPPRKGNRHVLRVIREILGHKPRGQGTDVAMALDYLSRVTRRRCVTILLSDLLDVGLERPLAVARKRHDLISVILEDPRELELPDVGLISLADPETNQRIVVDTGDARMRDAFRQQSLAAIQERERMLRSLGVDAVRLSTGRAYARDLHLFFRNRERRRRHSL